MHVIVNEYDFLFDFVQCNINVGVVSFSFGINILLHTRIGVLVYDSESIFFAQNLDCFQKYFQF